MARHSVVEEMYVSPAARKILSNGDEPIVEEIEEHAEVEELLQRWEGMHGDDPEFMAVFEQIRDGLLHHIAEEEEPKLFPEMQAALSQEEQEDLGSKITEAKKAGAHQAAPVRPRRPPGDKILGPPVGLMDRMRDLMSGRS
ncbi:MAG: hypothetical protein QOF53_2943, partial [Nocardioidaceae bacterium]|nr:hypothetical protein [Nocardioidaceae bacterium]